MTDYRIPLMRNTFIEEQATRAALAEWLATEPVRLSMDAKCAEFEHAFADWQGRKHAVLFNSGSSANLAVWQAVRNLKLVNVNGAVVVSALTWATNVMPLMQLGFRVKPLDIDPSTLNLMVKELEALPMFIQAVFITNAMGYLPDLDCIREWCHRHDVLLIEDNCEALGSELPTGKAGNFGLASSFSFYVAHHMSTIEGGMVCTDDDDLAEMLRMVRAHGWDRNLTGEQQAKWRSKAGVSDFDGLYTFYVPGYNLRPTEITGFLGLEQLRYLDQNINRRMGHFLVLEEAAKHNPDFEVLDHSHMRKISPFAFPIVCKSKGLRDQYVEHFTEAGVQVRPVIAGNITRQPFYRDHVQRLRFAAPFVSDTSGGTALPNLPGVDKVAECGFYFCLYPELTDEDLILLQGCMEQIKEPIW